MPLSESSSLNSSQDIIVSGNGSAGTPDIGVVSIQGITNGTPVSVVDPFDSMSASINITTQDLVSTTATGYANQSLITGTPTAGSTAAYVVNSIQTAMVLISGTWTGTLSTEVSEDSGVTWEPRSIHVIGTSTFSASITANVSGSMNAAGKSNIRIRATSAITGTATVRIVLSDNPSNFYIANSIKIVDGSSTPNVNTLTIKSASTAAVATDTAAVVAISPNNTVIVQGASGAAGTPSGGILTVQGVTGGTAFTIPIGAATSANQTTMITSLSSIDTGTPNALGSAASTASMPVVDVIATSSQYRAQSVTTTAGEALGAGTILSGRKLLMITPTNGIIYWGTSNAVTTTTGTPLFPNSTLSLSFTDNVHVWLIAAATTDTRIVEAS